MTHGAIYSNMVMDRDTVLSLARYFRYLDMMDNTRAGKWLRKIPRFLGLKKNL